jgi:hypothetical protein
VNDHAHQQAIWRARGTLKTDVAALKADMTEVKGTSREILDRVPAKKDQLTRCVRA